MVLSTTPCGTIDSHRLDLLCGRFLAHCLGHRYFFAEPAHLFGAISTSSYHRLRPAVASLNWLWYDGGAVNFLGQGGRRRLHSVAGSVGDVLYFMRPPYAYARPGRSCIPGLL